MQWKIWLLAARPKTLLISLSPVLIGSSMAWREGHFSWLPFIFTLLTGVCLQIGINFANDYGDFVKGADTRLRKGPLRVVQTGLVSISTMQKATALLFACSAAFGLYLVFLGGLTAALLLLLYLLCGFLYTAGPYPLAYLGLGEIFVFTLFGPIAVAIVAFLQCSYFSAEFLLAGIGPGALAAAVLLMNNLRDVEEDQKVEKKTVCVRFGRPFGKVLYNFLLALALAILFFASKAAGGIFLIPTFFLAIAVYKVKDPSAYVALFGKTAALVPLYALLVLLF